MVADGTRVTIEDHPTGSNNITLPGGTLKIKGVQTGDKGNYTCQAVDQYGTSKGTTSVNVVGMSE